MREQACSNHACEPHHRSDREVDSASHNDQGHANGDHRVDRGLQEDVKNVSRLIKAAREQREDDEKECDTRDDTGASQPFELGPFFRDDRGRLLSGLPGDLSS